MGDINSVAQYVHLDERPGQMQDMQVQQILAEAKLI